MKILELLIVCSSIIVVVGALTPADVVREAKGPFEQKIELRGTSASVFNATSFTKDDLAKEKNFTALQVFDELNAEELDNKLESVKMKGLRTPKVPQTDQPPIVIVAGEERSDKDAAAYLLKEGNEKLKEKNNEEALQLYDQALLLDPENEIILNNKGTALLRLHRNEDAIEAYDSALKIDSEYIDALLGKGVALIGLNRSAKALILFDKTIYLDPSDPRVWKYRGDALKNLSENDKAKESYEKAIEIDPEFDEAIASLQALKQQ